MNQTDPSYMWERLKYLRAKIDELETAFDTWNDGSIFGVTDEDAEALLQQLSEYIREREQLEHIAIGNQDTPYGG